MPKAIRWAGERDRYFGPFTYARESEHSPFRFSLMLGSGDGDDYAGCRLRATLLGRTVIMALPAIIKPWRCWHEITTEPTRSQMIASGRKPGYWDQHEREYGLYLSEGGYVSVHYGAQTHDSDTTQSWGWFMPWMQSRLVRRSWYGLEGEHVGTVKQYPRVKGPDAYRARYDEEDRVKQATPVARFSFTDFDGERIVATTHIVEWEWRLGERGWQWLSWFKRPHIRRSLDITFSSEVGKRKGSWKGGTIGHSIDMRPGELHEAAFRRYCAEQGLTFKETVAAVEPRQPVPGVYNDDMEG